MASSRRSSRQSWSAATKATWSVGLGLAGFVIVACGVLAVGLGYFAREEASEQEPSVRTRATLGMALGAVGIVVSTTWMVILLG